MLSTNTKAMTEVVTENGEVLFGVHGEPTFVVGDTLEITMKDGRFYALKVNRRKYSQTEGFAGVWKLYVTRL